MEKSARHTEHGTNAIEKTSLPVRKCCLFSLNFFPSCWRLWPLPLYICWVATSSFVSLKSLFCFARIYMRLASPVISATNKTSKAAWTRRRRRYLKKNRLRDFKYVSFRSGSGLIAVAEEKNRPFFFFRINYWPFITFTCSTCSLIHL